jgi:hypothetical protein
MVNNSMPGFIERNQGNMQQNEQGDSQTSYDPDLVRRARELGWRDKAEYKGPEDRWVEPNEFVRRGEEVLPIVKSQLERERERVADLERRQAESQRQIDERLKRQSEEWEQRIARQERENNARAEANAKVAQLALQRQRDRFMAELDAAKRAVVPAEQQSQYDDLVRREQEFYRSVAQEEEQIRAPIREIESEPERRETPQPQQNGQRQLSEEEMDTVTNWRKSNPWFDNRIDANRLANMIHVNILEERPNISLRENLELVSEEMKRRFPEKIGYNPQQQRQEFQSSQQQEFHENGRDNNRQDNSQQRNDGNQRRDDRQQDNYQSQQNDSSDRTQRQYSSVEGGQSFNSSGSPRNKKGWSQIHPNDRQMFENMVFPTGVYGNDLSKARETWANEYHAMYEE